VKKEIDVDALSDPEARSLLSIERKRARARNWYRRNRDRINNKRRRKYRRDMERVRELEEGS
jgi:hypothetical protein